MKRRRSESSSVSVLISLAILMVIWEGAVRVFSIPAFLLPPPTLIFAEIVKNHRILLIHAQATLSVILTGFLCSAVIGIPLAFAISFSGFFRRTVYPMIVFSQLIPKIALAPIFVIWFGFGFLPKVLIAFLVSFFGVVIQSIVGFTSLRPEAVRVAQSMGANTFDLFRKVRLPHALPNIFAGLKLAIASASIGAIVGEFIASQQGLGYLVLIANAELNTPLSFAGMLLLSLMGVGLYFIVETAERFFTGWHVSQRLGNA
ncbi:ABC transporter permease [Bosea sp. (in: a-proteobacteria)]|uniref:ABC transporter permease n=1 Tax=Bosea sp. (in: a-proteobacteria) TaxID=1871050 RepID=UPI0026023609|nr:ABC transporter permease [Bosea sp. (in: a-proteobacteria)]MCO5090339.1 ABC transporter permease [Bosea sp. (in: a-proteobacteria)]